MYIYVDGKLAAIKEGTTFEYVSENRLFSGSDGYTLSITFPLRGSNNNKAIFGNINRLDVAMRDVVFNCEIIDKALHKYGSLTIIEITEAEVKAQFLEGRSEQNFDKTLDEIYINELDLGRPAVIDPESITPSQAWNGALTNYEAVALPWVNNSTAVFHNRPSFLATPPYYPRNSHAVLSWQPYLLYITKKICEVLGYTCGFIEWEISQTHKYLLICNALPGSWYMSGYSAALPHWTVEEYFAKLEDFLGGEFDFDHKQKYVSFTFSSRRFAEAEIVKIDEVAEEFSRNLSTEKPEGASYAQLRKYQYKECDNRMWKYLTCDWYVEANKKSAVRYDSLSALIAANRDFASWDGVNHRHTNLDKLLYAADVDTYFIIRTISREKTGTDGGKEQYEYKCILQPINIFSPPEATEDAEVCDLDFVPVWLDVPEDGSTGCCIYMNCRSWQGEGEAADTDFKKTYTDTAIGTGKPSQSSQYYDRIYIGWYNGQTTTGKIPHPSVYPFEIDYEWKTSAKMPFSLALRGEDSFRERVGFDIDASQKSTFKFLADKVPDVRSLFIIRGKRYVCEKITATFTERGMSQLLKGEFYPVIES